MLYKLNTINCEVIYSAKSLKSKLYQKDKEELYIDLFQRIVECINDELTIVVFDEFNNKKFEDKILKEIGSINNVKHISSATSYDNKGLQFADNICSLIRRHLSGLDDEKYYRIIEKKVKKI